jgi:2-dehydropantoate 2-reductase
MSAIGGGGLGSAAWTVAVVGPGGVGGLVGAVLARAGNRVVYVATPETAAALNSGGMHLRSAQFGEIDGPATAVTRLDTPVDACLIATKATALDPALAGVPAAVLGDGLVLPLLNGTEHMTVLRRWYPAENVVAGAIRVESTRVAVGQIEHTSPFSWIDVASATAPPPRVAAIADRLRAAGFEVRVRDDETTLLWDKLAFLAPLALLTTHAGAPAGQVRDRRRTDLEAVVDEVTAVAIACGARVDAAGILAMFDQLPPATKSSMLRDTEAGRPTELDAIGGAVLRAARATGVDTPVTSRLVAEIGARRALFRHSAGDLP